MSTSSSRAATALLTEHLQYTPLSLVDDIIDSVNNLVYQGVGSLEAGLFATPSERLGFKSPIQNGENVSESTPESSEAKQEIEEGLHKLETLLNSTVDKNFDKFEIYVLRNILSVPEDLIGWIRLGHYEGIEHPLPADAPTAASINSLRQKLAASRRLRKAMRAEQRRNEVVLTQLKSMTGSIVEDSETPNFSFLSSNTVIETFGNNSQQPLTANATFTLSQLPALKAVLAGLREQLASLRETPLRDDTAKAELREERREYIEQRTQSHLRRNGQVVLDDAGAFSGKTNDPMEIEALEKVARTLNHT